MIVAGYYTINTPYEAEADKLRQSMDRLGIWHDILGCPDRKSWDANTKWKPMIILRALNIYGEDVLYVDADATFERTPETMPDCDIAVHVMDKALWRQDISRRRFSMISSTLFFRNNDAARELLLRWQEKNKTNIKQWDQRNLEEVLEFDCMTGKVSGVYRVAVLSARYCAIDKTMNGIDDVIIRQHQASRRLRRKIG